ncbi:MAG: D-alanyl-D-alanine carboxypeptidase family protein [Candidatus Aquicultorales bacterium]
MNDSVRTKTIALFTFIALLLSLSPAGTSATPLPEPARKSAAYILVDSSTKKTLLETDADARRAMASTTKMMTALIVAEKLKLDEEVAAGKAVLALEGAGLGIKVGETFTVRELLYGMMLRSANDAAFLLAEKVSGSSRTFVAEMNARAASLGLKNTHYVNPHGLDEAGHYSSARDLAAIAAEVLKNPSLREIISTKSWVFDRSGKQETLTNRNRLIGSYQAATGVKTGSTDDAGYCLVASAKQDNRELVAVVLGAPDEASAASYSQELLEYGFSLFEMKTLAEKGKVQKRVSLPYGRTVNIVTGDGLKAIVRSGADVTTKVKLDAPAALPVARGSKWGTIAFSQDGKELGEVPLIADRSAVSPTFFEWIAAGFNTLAKRIREAF